MFFVALYLEENIVFIVTPGLSLIVEPFLATNPRFPKYLVAFLALFADFSVGHRPREPEDIHLWLLLFLMDFEELKLKCDVFIVNYQIVVRKIIVSLRG